MRRPTFIVAEPEPDQALSSRKILLETFKFNVITAHSEQEMFEVLDAFPNVDAVILHDNTPGSTTQEIVRTVKKQSPQMQIVALSPTGDYAGRIADHVVNSHKPEELLQLLQRLFGDARKIDGTGKQLQGDDK
jgi:DNA-binding response OmpR family regulator